MNGYQSQPSNCEVGYKSQPSNCEVGCSAKSPYAISEELVKRQRIILDRLNQLEERVDATFGPIMLPSCPSTEACEKQLQNEWPPLFEELRSIANSADQSIRRINMLLDRVAL